MRRKTTTDRDHCSVADNDCKAPAGYRTGIGGLLEGTVTTKLKCSVCDRYVCSACSKKRAGKRKCPDCVDEENRDAARRIVEARLKGVKP